MKKFHWISFVICLVMVISWSVAFADPVILKLGDREITRAEVQEATQKELADTNRIYEMYYGMQLDVNDPEVIASAQSRAVTALKRELVLRAKAAELGFDQVTEEEIARAKENARSSWEMTKSYIKSVYLTEEQRRLKGEKLEKAILEQLDILGIKLEDYEKSSIDQITEDKLCEYAVKDVTVPDSDIMSDYLGKVSADEEKYRENAASWVAVSNKSTATLYYAPAGIRRVKQILIRFREDDQSVIDSVNTKINAANKRIAAASSRISAAQEIIDRENSSEEDKTIANEVLFSANAELEIANADLEAAQAELKAATDAAFANLDADADAVLETLKENPGSWDQLMEEKTEDPGMKAGAANAEKGYAVCEGMTGFDSAFVDAAMALKSVGDVSGKVRRDCGYCIVRYVGDVAEGAVDYESVKDALQSELLPAKQDEAYSAAIDQWISEAGIIENLEALNE